MSNSSYPIQADLIAICAFSEELRKNGQVLCLERGSPETECLEYRWRPGSTVFSTFAVFACGYLNTTFKVAPRSVEKPLGRVTDDREVRRNTAATAPIFSAATWTDGRLFAVVSFARSRNRLDEYTRCRPTVKTNG